MNEWTYFIAGIFTGLLLYWNLIYLYKWIASIWTFERWKVTHHGYVFKFKTEEEADEFVEAVMKSDYEVSTLCNTLGVKIESEVEQDDDDMDDDMDEQL